MNTLYLTAGEIAQFESLPATLRTDTQVIPESLTFVDTDQRRGIRFQTLDLKSLALQPFLSQLEKVATPEDVQAAFEALDFEKVSDQDFSELLFAIGPDGISALLAGALATSATADDVTSVVQLSTARHELLVSLQNFNA